MAQAGLESSARRLAVTVVTPTGAVAARDFDEVIAPGEAGQFGVLPGHVVFLSALKPGVLTLRSGTAREIFAVGPGFLQVVSDRVQILVEMAMPAASVDVAEARAEADAVTEQLRGSASETERAALQARFDWARARVEAAAPPAKS